MYIAVWTGKNKLKTQVRVCNRKKMTSFGTKNEK
jgi:hypothetical protein